MDSESEFEQEPWHITIILLEGLRLMRPEKSWRPIVTLEIDNHATHEAILGVDGQSVNQKEAFRFSDVSSSSKLDVRVWHRSQSKKKKKKRILVASASHCLSELAKRCASTQGAEPRLEIRLHCRSTSDKPPSSSSTNSGGGNSAANSSAAKGRPQKGAALHLKIRVPVGVDAGGVKRVMSTLDTDLPENSSATNAEASGSGSGVGEKTLPHVEADETDRLVDVQSEDDDDDDDSDDPDDDDDSEKDERARLLIPNPNSSSRLSLSPSPSPSLSPSVLSARTRAMLRKERREKKRRKVPWMDDDLDVGGGDGSDTDNDGHKKVKSTKDKDRRSSSLDSDTHTYVESLADGGSTSVLPEPQQSGLRKRTKRRKRITGYAIDSDECGGMSYSCSSSSDDGIPRYEDDDVVPFEPEIHGHEHGHRRGHGHGHSKDIVEDGDVIFYRTAPSGEVVSFKYDAHGEEVVIAFSDIPLPLYTERMTVVEYEEEGEKGKGKSRIFVKEKEKEKQGWARRVLAGAKRVMENVTVFGEMSAAVDEEDFSSVFRRLQAEWTFVGGLLVALAAVDTAVFSISPGSVFIVDSYAQYAIATSSVASGLGIACDAWFVLRYNWADLRTFKSRAKDIYSTYFFFSLSSRVPALCMFVSAVSLMLFLGIVAFDVWPSGVLAVSFVVGVVMSLQFLVYGVHLVGRGVMGVGRGVGRGMGRVRRLTFGVATAGSSSGAAGADAGVQKAEA